MGARGYIRGGGESGAKKESMSGVLRTADEDELTLLTDVEDGGEGRETERERVRRLVIVIASGQALRPLHRFARGQQWAHSSGAATRGPCARLGGLC